MMRHIRAYLENIRNSVVSIFEGLAVTMSWMFREPITVQYPFHPSAPGRPIGGPETLPERYRGLLEVDTKICTACALCEKACPIDCITIETDKVNLEQDPSGKPQRVLARFDIDLAKCMFCGLCVEPCPTGAIRHTREFEASVAHVENLLVRFVGPGTYVVPYKVKKGEAITTVENGSIIRPLCVARPWNSPAAARQTAPRL